MRMTCPHDWSGKNENTLFKGKSVNICAGICDRGDLCENLACKYCDVSEKGYEIFERAKKVEMSSPIRRSMIIL